MDTMAGAKESKEETQQQQQQHNNLHKDEEGGEILLPPSQTVVPDVKPQMCSAGLMDVWTRVLPFMANPGAFRVCSNYTVACWDHCTYLEGILPCPSVTILWSGRNAPVLLHRIATHLPKAISGPPPTTTTCTKSSTTSNTGGSKEEKEKKKQIRNRGGTSGVVAAAWVAGVTGIEDYELLEDGAHLSLEPPAPRIANTNRNLPDFGAATSSRVGRRSGSRVPKFDTDFFGDPRTAGDVIPLDPGGNRGARSQAPLGPDTRSSTMAEKEEKIQQVLTMGFDDRAKVAQALDCAMGDADQAVEYLLEGIPAASQAFQDPCIVSMSGPSLSAPSGTVHAPDTSNAVHASDFEARLITGKNSHHESHKPTAPTSPPPTTSHEGVPGGGGVEGRREEEGEDEEREGEEPWMRFCKLHVVSVPRLNKLDSTSFRLSETITQLEVAYLVNLTEIKSRFLTNCTSLREAEFHHLPRLHTIGSNWMYSSVMLQRISVRDLPKLTSIGYCSWQHCAKLRHVELKELNSLTSVGSSWMMATQVQALDLSACKGLEEIGDNFLYCCERIREFHLEPRTYLDLRILGSDFLGAASSLVVASICDLPSLESIGRNFLAKCPSLENVSLINLPELVELEMRFLAECPNLIRVTFEQLPQLTGQRVGGGFLMGSGTHRNVLDLRRDSCHSSLPVLLEEIHNIHVSAPPGGQKR